MKIEPTWITFYVYFNLLETTGTEPRIVHRAFRAGHVSLIYSLFQTLDPLVGNFSVSLGQYPRREYFSTQSTTYCAFRCLLDDMCNYIHFEQKGGTCYTYQLDGVVVKENGLCYFESNILLNWYFLLIYIEHFISYSIISSNAQGVCKKLHLFKDVHVYLQSIKLF